MKGAQCDHRVRITGTWEKQRGEVVTEEVGVRLCEDRGRAIA